MAGQLGAHIRALAMLHVTPHLEIPLREFTFSYARSSGAGGQNVNKVNTKVTLRWPVLTSPSLPDPVRRRFLERFGHRVAQSGDLLITSQRFRDQGRNVADCLEKLRAMLAEVAQPPRPRRATRPTRGSKQRRLAQKRRRGAQKQQRKSPGADDS